MTLRERVRAVLNYEPYDQLPLVHFGFWNTWDSVLYRWCEEGHIDSEIPRNWDDGNIHDLKMTEALGFEFNTPKGDWNTCATMIESGPVVCFAAASMERSGTGSGWSACPI